MELICKITDKNITGEDVTFEPEQIRIGARGIVLRNDGKIALFYKTNKNEYKLPGGGIENNEEATLAFKREVLEETGCNIEIIKELGITEEYKSQTRFKQISYVYVGKVIEDTKELNLTEKEINEGAKLLWETPDKALELITNCYDNLVKSEYGTVYSTKYVVLRDRKILEYYIDSCG